jgi:hypothetical protein
VLTSAGGWPSTTSGAASQSKVESSSNKQNYYVLDFANGATTYAEWTLVMPSDWDHGTITASFYWTAASGSGDLTWGLQGYSYGDSDAIDAAWGTAQEVVDTLITADDVHISGTTSAITLGGTPAASEMVQLRAYRKNEGTHAATARLLGIRITYTIA